MESTHSATTDAGALLAIWHDVEAGHVEEYLRWHSFEHLPERLALPGFVKARRYERSTGAGPRFLCLVDTADMAAFSSAQYLARVNAPTAWTRAMMPRYSRVDRILCRTLMNVGGGTAPGLCCIRFNLKNTPVHAGLPAETLQRLAALHGEHGLTQIQLCVTDAALSRRASEESRLRGADQVGDQDFLMALGGLFATDLGDAAERVVELLPADRCDLSLAHYAFSYAASEAEFKR